MATAKRPLTLLVLFLSVLVFAAACGSSNDPQTWAEAEEDGNLRPNFIRACTDANVEEGGVELTDAQLETYCECAFVEIVEYFGADIMSFDEPLADSAEAVAGRNFEAFRDFESDLRADPQTVDPAVEAILRGCADNAT